MNEVKTLIMQTDSIGQICDDGFCLDSDFERMINKFKKETVRNEYNIISDVFMNTDTERFDDEFKEHVYKHVIVFAK